MDNTIKLDESIRRKTFHIPYTGSITIEEFDNGDNKPPKSRWVTLTISSHGNGQIVNATTIRIPKPFDCVIELFSGIGES